MFLSGLRSFQAKPTSNGESCQIPFNLNNKTYFHCTEDNECHTMSGIGNCNGGLLFVLYHSVHSKKDILSIFTFIKGSFLSAKFNVPGRQLEIFNDLTLESTKAVEYYSKSQNKSSQVSSLCSVLQKRALRALVCGRFVLRKCRRLL